MRIRHFVAAAATCVAAFCMTANAEWGEPKPLTTINGIPNSGDKSHAHISPSGQQLYFTVAYFQSPYTGQDVIWVARWNPAISDWDSLTLLGSQINELYHRTYSPSVTADGKTLYFVSYGKNGGLGGYDIWHSEWQGSDWGPAVNCGANLNSPYNEYSACIMPDGQRIYFSSDRPNTSFFEEIWYCDKTPEGWGPAHSLGTNVNGYGDCSTPFVTADGSTLYYMQWHATRDIYTSKWNGVDWSLAAKVVPPSTVTYGEGGPSVSPDGKRLYFDSTRDTVRMIAELWVSEWVEGIEERRGDKSRSDTGLRVQYVRGGVVLHCHIPNISANGEILVRDTSGRNVRRMPISSGASGHMEWDWRDDRGVTLPAGVYFADLLDGQRLASAKLVKLE